MVGVRLRTQPALGRLTITPEDDTSRRRASSRAWTRPGTSKRKSELPTCRQHHTHHQQSAHDVLHARLQSRTRLRQAQKLEELGPQRVRALETDARYAESRGGVSICRGVVDEDDVGPLAPDGLESRIKRLGGWLAHACLTRDQTPRHERREAARLLHERRPWRRICARETTVEG